MLLTLPCRRGMGERLLRFRHCDGVFAFLSLEHFMYNITSYCAAVRVSTFESYCLHPITTHYHHSSTSGSSWKEIDAIRHTMIVPQDRVMPTLTVSLLYSYNLMSPCGVYVGVAAVFVRSSTARLGSPNAAELR